MIDIVTIRQGDTYPPLRAYLQMASGKAIRLAGATVKLIALDSNDNIKIERQVEIKDANKGYVEYKWDKEDTQEPGELRAEFEVTQQDGSIVTVPNDGYFIINITKQLG